MVFGQVVIGPPGSGKTTYCNGMSQYLQLIGRKVAFINLDPANDSLPYDCAINIEDLIKLSNVMNEHSLGPNGGLVYCMDYLEKNIDWLESKLKPLLKDHYFLFDFSGQVELFFLHSNAKKVIMQLIKKLDLRLTAVHLIDAHLCSDPGKYVSALLLSLSTMLHMELPHVNVLSKIDLIESYGKLAFNLDFYTDVEDLSYLQEHLDQDPRSSKYRKLTKELCEVIENFGLDKESVTNLVKLIDKTNGYIFQEIDATAIEYDCAINIEDLIKLSDVMNEHSLGPNGGIVYCMDYLEKNIDWLESTLKPLLKDHYFLFDFPGQVELFFLHSNAKKVIMQLIKKLDLRLTAVHLIDACLCSDPGKYVSALLLSLYINNVAYGTATSFNLDFYTDVKDLSYLQEHLDQDPRSSKYRKLTKELCEVVENFGLDKESVTNLVKLIDRTNGYIFQGIDATAIEFILMENGSGRYCK
ncbi:hypothetical protein LXL04_015272 [Taraxacum kok-saghyz]